MKRKTLKLRNRIAQALREDKGFRLKVIGKKHYEPPKVTIAEAELEKLDSEADERDLTKPQKED